MSAYAYTCFGKSDFVRDVVSMAMALTCGALVMPSARFEKHHEQSYAAREIFHLAFLRR